MSINSEKIIQNLCPYGFLFFLNTFYIPLQHHFGLFPYFIPQKFGFKYLSRCTPVHDPELDLIRPCYHRVKYDRAIILRMYLLVFMPDLFLDVARHIGRKPYLYMYRFMGSKVQGYLSFIDLRPCELLPGQLLYRNIIKSIYSHAFSLLISRINGSYLPVGWQVGLT